MKTSVVQIGTSPNQAIETILSNAKKEIESQSKLANHLRDLADQKFKATVEKVIEHLQRRMTDKAFDRKYTLNLKKYVGDTCLIECTIEIRDEVVEWLRYEGFTVSFEIDNLPSLPRRICLDQSEELKSRENAKFILHISW